tara:strand:+ start:1413 stop:1532 length:120 start_codon:yes stop_codon:yes gene_type:complete
MQAGQAKPEVSPVVGAEMHDNLVANLKRLRALFEVGHAI